MGINSDIVFLTSLSFVQAESDRKVKKVVGVNVNVFVKFSFWQADSSRFSAFVVVQASDFYTMAYGIGAIGSRTQP